MKKIAVIGAGLAGLSSALHGCMQGYDVTIFDKFGVGRGASGVSTGLLHPFPGKTGAISWNAWEGMQATHSFLEIAANAIGQNVASFTGIFRPAITQQQIVDYQANQNDQSIWQTKELINGFSVPGLWIPKGITVFSEVYLQGLYQACLNKGAEFRLEPYSPNTKFDVVIYAIGAGIKEEPFVKTLSLRSAIGQSLKCHWDDPLAFSLASKGYITLTQNPSICQVGSTYEHTPLPDPQKALELLAQVSAFYPKAKDFKVIEIGHGMRISPRSGHRPVIEKVANNTFVFTGLGSRGMLYHALYGKMLMELIKSC